MTEFEGKESSTEEVEKEKIAATKLSKSKTRRELQASNLVDLTQKKAKGDVGRRGRRRKSDELMVIIPLKDTSQHYVLGYHTVEFKIPLRILLKKNTTFRQNALLINLIFLPTVKALMSYWYRPDITRDEAIDFVQQLEEGSFIV